MPRPSRRGITVASYNVHGCVGQDGQYNPARTAAAIRALDADLIALQEVESAQHKESLLHAFRDDWTVIEGPTLQREQGHYGNAILSRIPVIDVDRLDISFPGVEPRGALKVRLNHHAHEIVVIATHLGLLPSERRQQVGQLLDWLGKPTAEPEHTTILMGDINEWWLWGRPLRWLHRWFGSSPSPGTFPARWPVFALDRVWIYPQHRLEQLQVDKTMLSRTASDHLPIRAEIVW